MRVPDKRNFRIFDVTLHLNPCSSLSQYVAKSCAHIKSLVAPDVTVLFSTNDSNTKLIHQVAVCQCVFLRRELLPYTGEGWHSLIHCRQNERQEVELRPITIKLAFLLILAIILFLSSSTHLWIVVSCYLARSTLYIVAGSQIAFAGCHSHQLGRIFSLAFRLS